MPTIDRQRWAERLKTAGLLALVLFAYGVAGRLDYEDAKLRDEAARQIRALVSAASWCGPKPGQVARQEWRDGRLHCAIYENTGYGRAPRIVAQAEAPALLHPLSNEEE